jgi:hypothetical protein
VRPAVAHRDTEALRRAHDDVGAPLPRRGEQHQREQVGRDRDEHATRVQILDERAVVTHDAGGTGVLQQHAEHAIEGHVSVRIADDHADADGLGTRSDDVDRLRVTLVVDEEHVRRLVVAGLAVHPVEHRHRLGGGGGLVEQRRVRHVHRGEVAHHRLEVEQRVEAVL